MKMRCCLKHFLSRLHGLQQHGVGRGAGLQQAPVAVHGPQLGARHAAARVQAVHRAAAARAHACAAGSQPSFRVQTHAGEVLQAVHRAAAARDHACATGPLPCLRSSSCQNLNPQTLQPRSSRRSTALLPRAPTHAQQGPCHLHATAHAKEVSQVVHCAAAARAHAGTTGPMLCLHSSSCCMSVDNKHHPQESPGKCKSCTPPQLLTDLLPRKVTQQGAHEPSRRPAAAHR